MKSLNASHKPRRTNERRRQPDWFTSSMAMTSSDSLTTAVCDCVQPCMQLAMEARLQCHAAIWSAAWVRATHIHTYIHTYNTHWPRGIIGNLFHFYWLSSIASTSITDVIWVDSSLYQMLNVTIDIILRYINIYERHTHWCLTVITWPSHNRTLSYTHHYSNSGCLCDVMRCVFHLRIVTMAIGERINYMHSIYII